MGTKWEWSPFDGDGEEVGREVGGQSWEKLWERGEVGKEKVGKETGKGEILRRASSAGGMGEEFGKGEFGKSLGKGKCWDRRWGGGAAGGVGVGEVGEGDVGEEKVGNEMGKKEILGAASPVEESGEGKCWEKGKNNLLERVGEDREVGDGKR